MQKQEEKKLELLNKNNQPIQQLLHSSNQNLPSQQIKKYHQYRRFRFQLAKIRFQMSMLVVAFCVAGYVGVRYWISVAIPVGSMSSYASPFWGSFPPDFGAQVGAIVLFGLLCMFLLGRINPDIARKMRQTEHS